MNNKPRVSVIRAMREYVGLTQRQLYLKANLSDTYLVMVERNYIKRPSLEFIHAILKVIAKEVIKQDLDLEYFIEDMEDTIKKESLICINLEEDYPYELDVIRAIYHRIQKQKRRVKC